jgi:hypothetical protein
MDIVILLSLDKSAIMIYAPPTFMILGLLFENEASDWFIAPAQSNASLAGQVQLFLGYIQMQLNGFRITYFASTHVTTVHHVQITKQKLG